MQKNLKPPTQRLFLNSAFCVLRSAFVFEYGNATRNSRPRSPPHDAGAEDSCPLHSPAGARAGAHVLVDHRSHQLDRSAAQDADDLEHRDHTVVPSGPAADVCDHPAPVGRHGNLGYQSSGRLGFRHHQLRLVDRHRSRRHADLRNSAAAPAGVAHVDQSIRRGDDAVRGGVGGDLPAAAYRPAVVRVLDVPLSKHDDAVAAVPQPADLGRLRGVHVRNRVVPVLVHRIDS